MIAYMCMIIEHDSINSVISVMAWLFISHMTSVILSLRVRRVNGVIQENVAVEEHQ